MGRLADEKVGNGCSEQLKLKVTTPHAPAPAAPLTALPPPLFADANLIVHALPLVPTPAEASTSPSSDRSSSSSRKRARSSASPSPPARAKPLAGADGAQAPADVAMVDADQVEDKPSFEIRSPDFRPQDLRGSDASRWRQMVLADMFRAQDPSAPAAPLPRSHTNQTPSYMPLALPPLDLPPNRRGEVLSYLATGPPLRGKFLVEEARKRGVSGQACSRLVKGERVWVPEFEDVIDDKPAMLPDGKLESKKQAKTRVMLALKKREAEVVEGEGKGRWVTPEECMSPGQDATVSRAPTVRGVGSSA